jgi:signal transduction histidine kinase
MTVNVPPKSQTEPEPERSVSSPFLSTAPAGKGLHRLTLAFCLITVLATLAVAPYAEIQLPPFRAFSAVYLMLLVTCTSGTVLVLYGQFLILRSASLLVLLCTYLLVAMLAAAQLLAVPGVFGETPLLHSNLQTLPSLWWSERYTLVLGGMAYAILARLNRSVRPPPGRIVPLAILGTLGLGGGIIALAALAEPLLPRLLVDQTTYGPAEQHAVASIIVLGAAALALLVVRRPRTVLDLTLTAVLWSVVLNAVLRFALATNRFQVGWYAGQVPGLIAAGLLLVVVLVNVNQFYRQQVVLTAQLDRELADHLRVESALRRSNRALSAYSRSLSALVHTTEPGETIKRICESIIAEPPYILAWVGVAEDLPGRPVRPLAMVGAATGYLDGLPLSWSEDTPLGRGPGGVSIRSGRSSTVADTETDPFFAPWRERARRFGLRSCVGIPLRIHGRSGGMVNIYASEPHAFGPAEMELFERLSEEISFAMELAEERARQLRTEADLRAALQLGPGVLYRGRLRDGRFELLQNFGDAARLIAEARPDGSPVTMDAVLRQVNWERLEHQLIAGEPLTEEVPFEPDGGATVWLRNTVNIAGRTPEGIDVVCYMREVTRERELALGGQHAARLLTMGEMASGMAHELFQPLSSISFAAEAAQLLLRRSPVNPAAVEDKIDWIVRGVERASQLINHMRIFARDERGPAAAVSWSTVLSVTLEIIGHRLRGIDVIRNLPADLPPVLGSAIPLEQVLINLLTNAVDAYEAHPAETRRTIDIIGRRLEDKVVLTVADHAGGIPFPVLNRLFEPFYTTKAPGKGTGLGLALAFGTINDFGGTITARNENGGALFEITLPAALPVEDAVTGEDQGRDMSEPATVRGTV